jgi:hypothetical protein
MHFPQYIARFDLWIMLAPMGQKTPLLLIQFLYTLFAG